MFILGLCSCIAAAVVACGELQGAWSHYVPAACTCRWGKLRPSHASPACGHSCALFSIAQHPVSCDGAHCLLLQLLRFSVHAVVQPLTRSSFDWYTSVNELCRFGTGTKHGDAGLAGDVFYFNRWEADGPMAVARTGSVSVCPAAGCFTMHLSTDAVPCLCQHLPSF